LTWIAPVKAGDPPRIENGLETRIERLLIADDEGNHYRALDVPARATVAIEKFDIAAEQTEMQKIYRAAAPSVPQGFDSRIYSMVSNRRYYGWAGRTNAPSDATLGSSVLEHNLRTVPGMFGNLPSPLEKRSYVAFVDSSPELVWGVPAPQPEASLHIVVGRW
jgi:hypothetical protein